VARSFTSTGRPTPTTLFLELRVRPHPRKQKAGSALIEGIHSFLFGLVFLINPSAADAVVRFWMHTTWFLHQLKQPA